MAFRNTTIRWGWVAQLLHWTIVVLIIAQFVLASSADDLPNGLEKLKLLATHKSIGMTVLMLALVRIAWRLANPAPPPPATTPRWQVLAARTSHLLLYLLLLLQPVTGWIMSSARNFPVSYFGWFQWPDLVSPSDELHERFEDIHHLLAEALLVVAVVHAAAALYHHFWVKDDVLRRMLPFARPEKSS
jgi:cytochrome b561